MQANSRVLKVLYLLVQQHASIVSIVLVATRMEPVRLSGCTQFIRQNKSTLLEQSADDKTVALVLVLFCLPLDIIICPLLPSTATVTSLLHAPSERKKASTFSDRNIQPRLGLIFHTVQRSTQYLFTERPAVNCLDSSRN
jgi:hypothetical protein